MTDMLLNQNNGFIYCIENLKTGCKYIGQTYKSLKIRWNQHISTLRSGKHINQYLQEDWKYFGDSKFSFTCIEECEINKLNDREVFWISKLNTVYPNGYNLTTGGNNPHLSISTRKKMVDNNGMRGKFGNLHPSFGRKASKETKDRISQALIGIKRSDETKRKNSDANINRIKNGWKPLSGKSHPCYGKHLSDEQKKKISIKVSGNKNPMFGKSGTLSPNFGKKKKQATSQYYGVRKRNNRWQAEITFNKKCKYLGLFCNEVDAAKCYNKFVITNNLPNPLNNLG